MYEKRISQETKLYLAQDKVKTNISNAGIDNSEI